MAGDRHDASTPQPEPQEVVLQMVTAPWVSQAIYVAAKLGIGDLLAAGPRAIGDLARTTGTHEASLYRLLRALVSVGIFARRGEHEFALTPLGDALRADHPRSARAFTLFFGSPVHWAVNGDLLRSVETGGTAFDRVFGMPFFDYLTSHPESAATFDAAMTGISAPHVHAILAAYDFSSFTHLVDVAGGRGHVLAAVLRAHPKLRGTLFDVAYSIEGAREQLAAASDLAGRVELVEGDFFASVPAGADAYFLKNIIHDWDDERSTVILRNCRRAIAPSGKLLVAEFVLADDDEPSFGKLLDLEMLLFAPQGRERTQAEYRRLLAGAGFELGRVISTATGIGLIEARPV